MFMNHEDISGVFVSAAEENQNFSFMCPIVSCSHIETNDEESLFEIKSKDGTITTVATKMIMIADGVASNMGRYFNFERTSFQIRESIGSAFLR